MIQNPAPPDAPVIVQEFPFPHAPPPWEVLPAPVVLLIVVAIIAGSVALLLPLIRAFARRIEGKGGVNPAVLEDLEHLRGRVADLEAAQVRMAELEERVDFAERLLARKAEPREIGH